MKPYRLIFIVLFFSAGTIFSAKLIAGENSDDQEQRTEIADKKHDKKVDLILRLGEGGFRDDRSPIGKLGGDQLALDFKPKAIPLAFSISSEYYTNSANPTHSYEIANLVSMNVIYMSPLASVDNARYFFGGGIGRLEVPKGESEPGQRVEGSLINFEVGINYLVIWKLGFYGAAKYLYAKKSIDGRKVINFDEKIFLLGVTLNFSL